MRLEGVESRLPEPADRAARGLRRWCATRMLREIERRFGDLRACSPESSRRSAEVVRRRAARREGAQLVVEAPPIARGRARRRQRRRERRLPHGDRVRGRRASHFDAVRETLERTALGELRAGARVNLERALRADAPPRRPHRAGPRGRAPAACASCAARATTCGSSSRASRALRRAAGREGLGGDRRRLADRGRRRPRTASTSR